MSLQLHKSPLFAEGWNAAWRQASPGTILTGKSSPFTIIENPLRYSRPILLDGMHTYNTSPHFEVIDIKTRRFNLLNLVFRFLSKFRRA